jgi:hypothetical protein
MDEKAYRKKMGTFETIDLDILLLFNDWPPPSSYRLFPSTRLLCSLVLSAMLLVYLRHLLSPHLSLTGSLRKQGEKQKDRKFSRISLFFWYVFLVYEIDRAACVNSIQGAGISGTISGELKQLRRCGFFDLSSSIIYQRI